MTPKINSYYKGKSNYAQAIVKVLSAHKSANIYYVRRYDRLDFSLPEEVAGFYGDNCWIEISYKAMIKFKTLLG